MHDRAAGKVQSSPLPDEAGLAVHLVDDLGRGVGVRAHPEPDHVRDRRVAEREPQDDEHEHGRELGALGDRAED